MSKELKYYVCVHSGCTFKTEKRKAIYSHLLRAHSERKEDYECEYCTDVYHREEDIEQHLQLSHPDQDFTYTCLSRIENVIEECARLGQDQRRPQPHATPSNIKTEPRQTQDNEKADETHLNIKKELIPGYDDDEDADSINDQTGEPNGSKIRTKASVNASLNSIAKVVKNNVTDIVKTEPGTYDDGNMEFENETDSSMFISKPSGLKIKLNLKRIAECSPTEPTRDVSASPPILERHTVSRDASLDSSDFIAVSPPEIAQRKPTDNVSIREKASKYFDPLEVYHSTDSNGMRCCPFCTYKTTKNTIRVHLSGIHKIYFVKCSLCDYKAAFPHQITQHGVKFHKTTNLNVIQLSKESREKVIAKLPKSKEFLETQVAREQHTKAIEQEAIIENDNSGISYMDDVISSGSCSDDDNSLSEVTEEKVYKPPKCQTSKTDYYNIKVENGVYLYCCKLCPFQTPVRSTIYTHKYKHEDKTYRCAYCEFTSSPRSNVVHHCRTKHKHRTIAVYDVGHEPIDDKMRAERERDESHNGSQLTMNVKQEPMEEADDSYGSTPTFEKADGTRVSNINVPQRSGTTPSRPQQTIIKVPQFKRTFPSDGQSAIHKAVAAVKKRRGLVPAKSEYKWSLNKMYRINPTGTPRYMCAQCPYACDTHPKMKHHLYRHRPQQYKCPYCDHRKYPRSYVVRHVRDTHRGKPLRVIDLGKEVGPDDTLEPLDTPVDDNEEFDEDEDAEQQDSDTNYGLDETNDGLRQDPEHSMDSSELGETEYEYETPFIKSEPNDDSYTSGTDQATMQDETENTGCKSLSDRLNYNLNKGSNDRMFSETPDVSPNFSDTVYTSTPIIESIINNGEFPSTPKLPVPVKLHEKKKSTKDYRISAEGSPKYICNKCNYGTDIYKTIHNHMYRHESQRYQCPYCGYRRSPKSFVENHIREVHKGNPVIVTELSDDHDTEAPIGSPRQCVNRKRKEPGHKTSRSLSPPSKTVKGDQSSMSSVKTHGKWPAPKPASKVNLAVSKPNPTTSKLQIPVKQKSVSPGMGPNSYGSVQYDDELPDMYMAEQDGSADDSMNDEHGSGTGFKEGNRTTFKTMYKCVFDPETCNHISKDKSKMKQHLFMHVEYRPWTCDLCEMTASQSSHIKNHVRGEHPNVSEMSFKYKKHNYLEKHIESFLTKGLFTVPVNEYRKIMDMKGTTKHCQRSTFTRDAEGFIQCPHCTYKTKSGGMTDHVKMKHMHPRFKCHWCDYKAFYRSEIRKHHRKEKSHNDLEFKTQELDLSQMLSKSGASAEQFNLDDYYEDESHVEPELSFDESAADYGEQDWSSQGSSPDHSNIAASSEVSNTDISAPNKVIAHDVGKMVIDPVVMVKKEHNINDSYGNVRSNVIRRPAEIKVKKGNKFKCGYCSFSASLRVKVKMHCSKKHAEKLVRVVEPSANTGKIISDTSVDKDNNETNVTQVEASDWKGTKFEQDLRNAGVSRLNLASLFPKGKMIKIKSHKYSDNDDEPEFGVETLDKDDKVVEYKESPNHLTIPFKKAPARKKIEIPVTRTVKTADNDKTFKIPFAPSPEGTSKTVFPVSCTRVSDELPKVALRNIKEIDSHHSGRVTDVMVMKESFAKMQEDISDTGETESDIIVEPLEGTTGDTDKDSASNQVSVDNEGEETCGSFNVPTATLKEPLASSEHSDEHSQILDQENGEACDNMDAMQIEGGKSDKHSIVKEGSENQVQTTFPNATPVVLEDEASEDEDEVKLSEDYNIEGDGLVNGSENYKNEDEGLESEDYTIEDNDLLKDDDNGSVNDDELLKNDGDKSEGEGEGLENEDENLLKDSEQYTVVINTANDCEDGLESEHSGNASPDAQRHISLKSPRESDINQREDSQKSDGTEHPPDLTDHPISNPTADTSVDGQKHVSTNPNEVTANVQNGISAPDVISKGLKLNEETTAVSIITENGVEKI